MLNFSTSPVTSPIEYPKNLPRTALTAVSLGPNTLALEQFEPYSRLWTMSYSGSSFTLTDGTVSTTLALMATGVTFFDFTFETSNSPLVVYTNGVSCFLYWFDPQVNMYVSTNLGLGTKCFIDYLTDGTIIVTKQRGYLVYYYLSTDRYTTENQVPIVDVENLTQAHVAQNGRFRVDGTYRIILG